MWLWLPGVEQFLEALLESGETQTVLDLREIIARMQADQADLEKRLAEALAEKENAMQVTFTVSMCMVVALHPSRSCRFAFTSHLWWWLQGWALCQKQVSSLEAALAERDQQLIAAEAECKRLQELCDALQVRSRGFCAFLQVLCVRQLLPRKRHRSLALDLLPLLCLLRGSWQRRRPTWLTYPHRFSVLMRGYKLIPYRSKYNCSRRLRKKRWRRRLWLRRRGSVQAPVPAGLWRRR